MSNTSYGYLNGVSVGSGGSTDIELNVDPERLADGATIKGRVNRATTSYDVDVVWVDDQGNEVLTESLASGVAAGTATNIDQAARSPNAIVRVSDAGSGSGDVDGTAYMS